MLLIDYSLIVDGFNILQIGGDGMDSDPGDSSNNNLFFFMGLFAMPFPLLV